jgi:luciferase family oxidoreductase group 1
MDLAALADRLGYHRFWLSEHHGTPMLAGPAPELLIGPIAAATSRIRVGAGGVMLPYYSPLKVAEQFSLLCALYPERIDLGVGRAPGTDPVTAFALQRDRRQAVPDDFPSQLAELIGYLRAELPDDNPFSRLAGTLPGHPATPQLWLLGSSGHSGGWAGDMGLPYAFADFINPAGAELVAGYRRSFLAGQHEHASYVAVAVWAICAETEDEANELAASMQMALHLLRRGRPIPLPHPRKAIDFLRSVGQENEPLSGPGRRMVVGDPQQVRAGLEAVAAEYGADELIVVTTTYDHQARRRSYELIASALELTADDFTKTTAAGCAAA